MRGFLKGARRRRKGSGRGRSSERTMQARMSRGQRNRSGDERWPRRKSSRRKCIFIHHHT